MDGAKLIDYAIQKFQDENYEEALEAFVLAYDRGYEQEWILDNIYSCYVQGNEETFRQTYEEQVGDAGIGYEECKLDFIPYQEGTYYIFDKELAIFRGVFSIDQLRLAEKYESLEEAEFSAVSLVMDWDWSRLQQILTDAKERKIYAVCTDISRALSFLKIPELQEYMKNVKMFPDYQSFQEYFHKNTSVYLPLIIYGSPEEQKKLLEIRNQEHAYRLTPEGRNTDNILLTIGIPTYNRGNLLLKRLENLLSMQYDAEIEFSISKNGMEFYQEEYDEVGRMTDARINYHDHGRTLNTLNNWHYVVEMSHGKYVLMVSDEDDVINSAVEHYLKLLSDYPKLNMVRAKTDFQFNMLTQRKYGKKGVEAFSLTFLFQNYLSGLIFRRADFLQANLLELERFSDNKFYISYTHEWWCAMMNRLGDYMAEPVTLIHENKNDREEEVKKFRKAGIYSGDDGNVGNSILPIYSTYEARLEQMRGQIDFLHFFCGQDMQCVTVGLTIIIFKAKFLFELAWNLDYDHEHFADWIDRYAQCCLAAVDEFPLEREQTIELLQDVKTYCCELYELIEVQDKEAI